MGKKKKRYNPLDDPLTYVPFVGLFVALYKTLEEAIEDEEDEEDEDWEDEEY